MLKIGIVGMGGMGGGIVGNLDSVDVANKKYTEEYLQGIADQIRKA